MPEPVKKTQAETIDELMAYIKQGGSLGLEIEKRLEELPSRYAVLLVTRQEKYDLIVANLVKTFTKKGISGIFVTLNKGGTDLLAMLKENGVECDSMFIVDAITKSEPKLAKDTKISFVGSPHDLTEMEAQINDFIAKLPAGEHFFILDSLSTMLIYNAEKTIEKFVHSLSERLRHQGFKVVFTIMSETRPEIITVLSQFCDKVIRPSPQISP